MKNNTAVFNAKEKKINFKFNNELFEVDLTEGDLDDSWNGITLKNEDIFDSNFSWQEESEPSLELYATFWDDKEELRTNTQDWHKIVITQIIGTRSEYFLEMNNNTNQFKDDDNMLKIEFNTKEFSKCMEKLVLSRFVSVKEIENRIYNESNINIKLDFDEKQNKDEVLEGYDQCLKSNVTINDEDLVYLDVYFLKDNSNQFFITEVGCDFNT